MKQKARYVIHRSEKGTAGQGRPVVVIGAGLTGLAVAHGLRKAGLAPEVVEARERPGGAVATVQREGFLVEEGPNTLQVTTLEQLLLLGELGLADTLLTPGAEAKNRFVLKGGKLVAVPTGPGGLLKTPLFSLGAKVRLLQEPFIRPRKTEASAEESVADFVRRRLGREVLQYAVDPFVSGIYAGDPEALSLQAAFPKLAEMEAAGGSLLKGALALKKSASGYKPKAVLMSFENGLQALPMALARGLGTHLHTGATVTEIARCDWDSGDDRDAGGRRWRVAWTTADGKAIVREVPAVIVATPAHALGTLPLPTGIRSALQPVCDIPHPPLVSVAMGFAREAVTHPLDGFGVLVPSRENRRVLGVLFNSSLFPGRAPKGHVTLTAFVGGSRQPDLAKQENQALEGLVLEELRGLLGVRAEPVFTHCTRWPKAIPQYQRGHAARIDAAAAVEAANPGLYLAGNWRGGIAAGNCLTNGLELARRITAELNEGTPAATRASES